VGSSTIGAPGEEVARRKRARWISTSSCRS
jgi:hypothetical protein